MNKTAFALILLCSSQSVILPLLSLNGGKGFLTKKGLHAGGQVTPEEWPRAQRVTKIWALQLLLAAERIFNAY